MRRTFLSLSILLALSLAMVFTVHAFGGGSSSPPPPPPPPPPCSTASAGCYDVNENRADYGSLSADNFGYYYGESACITGGCRCTTEKTTSQAEQTDPDQSEGACSCLASGSWDPSGNCCGNEENDCGVVAAGALCQIDANYRSSSWVRADQNRGEITYLGCSDTEHLSDGSNWFACDQQRTRTVQNHEYLCTGTSGEGSWIECCGSGQCLSSGGGVRLSTGQSVEIGDVTYYCSVSNEFLEDLDEGDQETCQRAGFTWTGTKCCGEPQDEGEFYNDQIGGCFDGEPALSVSFTDESQEIVNYNGRFYGCLLNTSSSPDAQSYLQLTDDHTGEQLVSNQGACTTDPSQTYFCSSSEGWAATGGQQRDTLKTVPFQNAAQPSECCGANQCWDGGSCVSDQSGNANQPNHLGEYRCVQGDWIETSPQTSPDGETQGFCPSPSQCLVNPAGNAADNNDPSKNPQCINHSQYMGDDLCFEGNWTSRTRNTALKILDIKPSNDEYVLFCDTTQNTLNEVNTVTASTGAQTQEILSGANNICVLRQADNIIVGTTFNTAVTDQTLQSLFGIQGCAAPPEDGEWHSCGSDNRIWYNPQQESLIFSDAGLTAQSTSFTELFVQFVRNPVKTITGQVDSRLGETEFSVDESYRDSLGKFSRLYISENGPKRVFAVLEGTAFQTALIEYTGFDTDICDYTSDFTSRQGDQSSGIECWQEGDDYYLLLQGGELTTFRPENVWTDLTSKLRVE